MATGDKLVFKNVNYNQFNFKNRLINGAFQIWQRSDTKSISNGSDYVADRWSCEANNATVEIKKETIFSPNEGSLVSNVDPFGDGSGVALWQLDGNANDTGGNYNGTWSGTEQYDTGKWGQAAKFDGSSYITISNDIYSYFETGKSWTISCWARWDALNNWSRVLDFYGYILIANNSTSNTLEIDHRSDGQNGIYIYLNGFIIINNLYHITISYDNNLDLYKLYINSNIITPAFVTKSGSPDSPINAFGKSSWSADSLFSGLIDQVRIFNRALTGDEILKLYIEDSQYIFSKHHAKSTIIAKDTTNTPTINPFIYKFEGQHIADLIGQPMTLSFDFMANKSGTYNVKMVTNCYDGTQETYTTTFDYTVSTDWQRFSITIPADAFTKQVNNDENLGATLYIANNTESNLDANDWLRLKDVQLEQGSVATEFEYVPYEIEELRCKRYYRSSSTNTYSKEDQIISMRTSPTIIGSAAPYIFDAEL